MKDNFLHCKTEEWKEEGKIDDDCWTFRNDIMGQECSEERYKYSCRPITEIELTAKLLMPYNKQTTIELKESLQ